MPVSNGKYYTPEEYNRMMSGKDKTKNIRDKGYPSSTSPSSQPKQKSSNSDHVKPTHKRSLPYVGEGKDFEVDKGNLRDRGYPSSTNPTSQPKIKKTRGTLEAKEKAKTRSAIEAAFVGNSKSAPPSKEEQERMRKQGARNAANQYSWKYSGRRG